MRKFAVIMPVFALLAGIAGMLLRTWELTTAFEPESGLAIPGASATRILIAVSIAAVAIFVLFAVAVSRQNTAPAIYAKAFAIRNFPVFALSGLIGAALAALVVLDFLLRFQHPAQAPAAYLVLYLFALLSAISVVVLSVATFTGRAGTWSCLFSVISPLFFCFLMLVIYRTNGANPVLQDFCWLCLFCAAATLATYYAAGFLFGRAKTRMTIIAHLTAIYLGVITLADLTLLAEKILAGLFVMSLLLNTGRFIAALSPRQKDSAPPAAEEHPEAEAK